jgi:hypothetical protein
MATLGILFHNYLYIINTHYSFIQYVGVVELGAKKIFTQDKNDPNNDRKKVSLAHMVQEVDVLPPFRNIRCFSFMK